MIAPGFPPLTPFEAKLALSVCPTGTRILKARYFPHHSYPCPILVTAIRPDGTLGYLAVRSIRHRMGRLEREAALYPVLARLGLPVPHVLAGPARDPGDRRGGDRLVLSVLPGDNLQRISQKGGRHLKMARDLVIEAIQWLHRLTPRIKADPAHRVIPHGGLTFHLGSILERKGPWLKESVYREAARTLMPALEKVKMPLVFSNGDYQPANFLADRGRLSGFLDFEYAWFEDPLYGFTKYPIYNLHPLNGAGVVEAYLKRHGLTKRDFAPRLALACLATLNREIPVGPRKHAWRKHVLGLLRDSLKVIG